MLTGGCGVQHDQGVRLGPEDGSSELQVDLFGECGGVCHDGEDEPVRPSPRCSFLQFLPKLTAMHRFGPNPDAWDHRPSVESLRDDPNGTNTNMYEQPYGGRPGSHVGGGGLAHSRMYSESSLKNVQNYDQPPPGEPDYEYAQARQAQGGGGYGDQYEQQQQQQQYAGGGRQSRYVEHEEADDGRYGQQDGAQYRQRYGDEAEGKGEAYGQQQYGQQQYGGYR